MNRSFACLLVLVFDFAALSAGLPGPAAAAESFRPARVPGATLSEWLDLTPESDPSNRPTASEDGAMMYDPRQRRVVLFGGKDDDDRDINELWSLDLLTLRWQKIEPEGDWPPASEDHSVVYDPIGYRMILFGGELGTPSNKTWSLDLATLRWHDLTDSTAPYREDHTAVYDSRARRMVVFGGRDTLLDLPTDVWAFNLDPDSPRLHRWDRIPATGRLPTGRSDHAAIYDSTGNRMIVFGGWNRMERDYLGDTWAFDFPSHPDSAGRWEKIRTKESAPPKRRHVVGVHDPLRDWFIIMGGRGDEGYLNDVWALDLRHLVWINITPGPEPRMDHQAVFDPETRRMLLYAGDAKLKRKFHDLWELEIRPDLPLDELLKAAGAKGAEPAKSP